MAGDVPVSTPPTPGTMSSPAASVPPGRATRRRLLLAAAPALYLVLAVGAMWPGLFTGHDTIVGSAGDPSFFIWQLQWVPFALGHHLNPLLTDYLHYPTGANMMWNGGIILPALVLTPVTELFGPIVSYNVLAVLGMWLSGWGAFLAVRRYSRWWLAAAVGGLLYEFSPFMASQITGHAHMFVAVFPPLLVIFADEILVRQRHRAWLVGGLLGLATACQLLTGTEVLAISALMAVPALITLAIIFRARLRERLHYALQAAASALVAFVVLAGYPLYVLLLGPQRPGGALEGYGFVARPESFLLPNQLTLISGPTSVFDSSVYIGVPLLILAVVVTVRMRRRAVVVASAVTLACAMVLALGGRLTIHGSATRIPLPWLIPAHLPVTQSLLPVRLMVAGYLALAVIVAVFLDRVLDSPLRTRIAGLAVVAVALVPLIPTLPIVSTRLPVPAFFTDGSAQRLPATGSVLMTPYGNDPNTDDTPELWAALSGLAFTTQLGSVYTPLPGGGHLIGPDMDPLGTELNALTDLGRPAPAALSSSARATYLGDMRAHGVTTVIVGPSAGEDQVVRLMAELLGRPGTAMGGVVVWYDVGAVTG
ncbi:MAG: hypothetical protein ACLQGJ_00310 [Candidatus Dormibacteria bacterium]